MSIFLPPSNLIISERQYVPHDVHYNETHDDEQRYDKSEVDFAPLAVAELTSGRDLEEVFHPELVTCTKPGSVRTPEDLQS